ncbi:MAG: DNA polymerase III subunit alpha, partial [Burkholderiales bacterium]|nr:DNA polymerase III subunit alpha [Burkholderiales bacterium]
MQHFVHLRLHTEYSVTDGILRIKDIIKLAQNDQMLSIAITDLHNMFALIKFFTAARENGIKPIIGCELNVNNQDNLNYKIIILVKNNSGYTELCDLITRSYVQNKINETPYIKEEWLLGSKWQNLIVLSGGLAGDIAALVIANRSKLALDKAKLWQQAFPDSYYLELQRINNEYTNLVIDESLNIADKLAIPVVATHPIQFAQTKDFEAHEVRVCIASGELLDDQNRQVKFTADQYFLTQQGMIDLFSDIPSSITNSIEIAKKCNFEITLGKYFLPNFTTPNDSELKDYLSVLANEGLNKRLDEIFDNAQDRLKQQQKYKERLEVEIETIVQMGFPGYFLIVADFINWAKVNDIPVGPGRGSGAGSLVAFALGITDLDPLQYNLIFERFLNPERVSMPDFDIDFCQDKRELVIDYVKHKYGLDAVAQIATFGTMSSRAVIKDVGRTLAIPYWLCDSISKLILNTPAKSYSLQEAYTQFGDLKEKIDNADEDVLRLWEMSLQLEDLTRNIGKHAAGVLIAPSKLTNFCPLYLADGMQTSQFDKDDVEQVGLVKFDFLGLRNLTTLKDAVKNIYQLHNVAVKLSNYNFTDSKTYKLLQDGNTHAVFQLESRGMRRVLVKLEPDNFEEIIALLALYRPGPLGSGMVDDFVKRKKGEQEVNYFHPDLKNCLEPTYGVIVYQEQVMQISQIIGGYSLGGADLLRRAMGKKKPEEMKKHKDTFIEGAVNKGYTADLAENLFDLMAKFAEYGFNKSHSAAYAVISYHTAYLKAHYPGSFLAATMSSELNNTDKLYELYQDCLDNNITVLPPDINKSEYVFTPLDENNIRYALGAIKGVGQHVAQLIIQERQKNGEYTSFVDFVTRTFKTMVNKKTLEGLIKSGAFDLIEANRAQLLGNLARIIERIEQKREQENQASLFDDFINDDNNTNLNIEIKLDDVPAWGLKQQLVMEKQALGYYLSGSLFDEYKDIVKKLGIDSLSKYSLENDEMQELINSRSRDKNKVLVCGVVNNLASKALARGGKMHFINIEDDAGSLELVLYENEFQKYKDLIKLDEFIFIEGELMYDRFRGEIKVTAKTVYTIEQILTEYVGSVTLIINNQFDLNEFKAMLHPNGVKLQLYYYNEVAKCKIELKEDFK